MERGKLPLRHFAHLAEFERRFSCEYRLGQDGPSVCKPRSGSAAGRNWLTIMRNQDRIWYYWWVIGQREYATDILFRDRAALEAIKDDLATASVTALGASGVMHAAMLVRSRPQKNFLAASRVAILTARSRSAARSTRNPIPKPRRLLKKLRRLSKTGARQARDWQAGRNLVSEPVLAKARTHLSHCVYHRMGSSLRGNDAEEALQPHPRATTEWRWLFTRIRS